MTLDELIDFELEQLEHKATQFMVTVEETLREIRKGESTTLRLNIQDRYRLMKLKIWMERYQIPLKFILETLLPVWEGWMKRHSTRTRREGLGIKITTLCGKKSEQILEDQIQKDFPNAENRTERLLRDQIRILEWEVRSREQQDDDGIKTPDQKKKTLLDFRHPKGYVRHYRTRIRREGRQRERIIQEMRRKPYRGNPFC